MKRILFLIIFTSISLYAFKIEPEAQIISDYVFRGKSQTLNSPAIITKVIFAHGGLHAGVWASRVKFDTNSTNINPVISKASEQVDLFAGYELRIGRSVVGVGYVDRRYFVNNTLESNISSEYYAFLNMHLGIDTTIKSSYDIKNKLDPFLLEITFKDTRGATKSYATYGRFLNSTNSYWKLQVDSPLKYFRIRGYLSFALNKYVPEIGKEDTILTIGYKF